MEKQYVAIDLKSFYASVECVERGLDPLTTKLVVADESRTDKTICLAVSPALKAYGIGGRARLWEVKGRLKQVERLTGEKVDFIIAPPRMALYLQYSRKIVDIYRHYIADDDIHVYSVDEVFLDVTGYLKLCYKISTHELAMTMIRDVLRQTGITATAGIGTNLYLAKVAMDIVAKHIPADKDGVRIAELNEMSYREQLWSHRPLSSFWRFGRGITERLAKHGIDTMGKLARLSITHGEWLYRQFGIQAELIIDHAWGYEPCTIADIKAYKPQVRSLSHGQVLKEPYPYHKARIVVREMADGLSMELFAKHLVTNQLVLTINYDTLSLSQYDGNYEGEIVSDYYGRKVPKKAHGTERLDVCTSSANDIIEATDKLFARIANKVLFVRRITLVAGNVVAEDSQEEAKQETKQLLLWDETDEPKDTASNADDREKREREKRLQQACLNIKKQFGKNAILKGFNFKDGATARERNEQIGGHAAGRRKTDK